MSSKINNSGDNYTIDEEYLDITDLVRHAAFDCLSHSLPFTPNTKGFATVVAVANGNDNDQRYEDAVIDGTLLEGLCVQGGQNLEILQTTTRTKYGSDVLIATKQPQRKVEPTKLPQLNLLDAMSALELGDKRMDCCEIPYSVTPTESCDTSHSPPAPSSETTTQNNNKYSSPKNETRTFDSTTSKSTFPPRIAPTCLSDGVPLHASLPMNDTIQICNSTSKSMLANSLLIPAPPCHSLLPHWNTLRLSSTSLLPLLLLQLTALEAYIGTNNGGSNAAETLYCMLWFHDGVLLDMAERLGVRDVKATLQTLEHSKERIETSTFSELNVARWILFASSLGIVRIAEAVRLVVVSADFYEEEDFGVALHGEHAILDDQQSMHLQPLQVQSNPSQGQTSLGGSSVRFCPALQGSQYCEVVWDTALSYIKSYRSTWTDVNTMDANNPVIDALETILRLQQSFYQAVHMLSNLSGSNVRIFANLSVQRSRETVNLFEKLLINNAMTELSTHELVGLNGQLQTRRDEAELNLLLCASFDPYVNRRFLGNSPVRKACFRCLRDVTSSLSNLAAELEWGVCNPILSGDTFGRITTMLRNNSLRGCGGVIPMHARGKESLTNPLLETELPVGMNILSRSLLVLNLYFDDKLFGQYDFAFLVAQHMTKNAVPDKLLVSSNLLSIMVKPMYETLKALCLNRHRERGYTETILLPSFELLQHESAALDEKFKVDQGLDETTPSYATNYVILITLQLMERYLGLGIELGLFPHWNDLRSAFWYRDYLLSALINLKGITTGEMVRTIDKEIRHFMEWGKEGQLQAQKKKKTKSKRVKKTKQQSAASLPSADIGVNEERMTEDFEEQWEYTSLLIRRDLCRGLVQSIDVLYQKKLLVDLPASVAIFTTHQKRFEKRYEAFRTFPYPPFLTYNDCKQGVAIVTSHDLLASATNSFRSAKSAIDWILNLENKYDDLAKYSVEKHHDHDTYRTIQRQEIQQISKVCMHNLQFIYELTTESEHRPSVDTCVRFNFSSHKQYCLLSIS